MAAFHRIQVGDLIAAGEAELKTGPFGTQLKASEYTEEGTTVINVRNIGMGSIKADKLEYISDATRDRLSSHLLRSGDIVFGRKGAVERHVFIRKEQDGWFQGSDCLRLRFNSPRVLPLFASYFFITEEHQRWMMNQCSHGATMSSLNQDILERIDLPLPPLPIQKRIAGILSAYDELIENNQRRIRILEAMARNLYREWFVHFRFPGHESIPRVPSFLGEIPQGWQVTELAKVCADGKGIQTGPFGSQLHEADYSDEGVPVVMPKDLIGFRIRTDSIARIPEETAEKLSRHRMQLGDIVYGRRGDIGRRAFIMAYQAGWFCGTGCLRIRPNPRVVDGWFLFNYLGQDDVVGRIQGRAQGVTMPNLNTGVLASLPVLLPPRNLQAEFARLTFPIEQVREALSAKSENLRRTRDLLLPRLLSGQVNLTSN
jgi:type I restriction enzyme S subunit